MKFGNREYRITLVLITVVLAIPLIFHAINGFNSRMLADDYCFAANVMERGFSGSMAYYFYNWQGTFSSTATQSALALGGAELIRWLPATIIVVWWAAMNYLISQLAMMLKFQLPRLTALALATMLVYALVEGSPTIFQSFYWTSGSVTYAVPMVLFTLVGAVLLRLARANYSLPVTISIAFIAGGASAFLAGFSPIFAVFELGFLALSLVGVWLWRPKQLRVVSILLIACFIGAAIGMAVMVAAPGNSVRQSYFPKPPSLFGLMGINFTNTTFYVGIP